MDQPWVLQRDKHVSLEDINAARTLAAATLYEANGRSGALDSDIRQMAPGLNLCGTALTVRCQSGDKLTLHAAVALAQPDDVIVADVGDYGDAGQWGEILTVAAKSRKIAGLVINGGVRDIAMLAVHEFPVFARAVSMKAATKQIKGSSTIPSGVVMLKSTSATSSWETPMGWSLFLMMQSEMCLRQGRSARRPRLI